MQISLDKAEGLERNLNVTIPADKINSLVADKLKELGKQVKISGFRPGKIPKNILSQRYGTPVKREVIGDLINSTIQDAVKEHKLEVADTPEVTDTKDLEDGGYSFVAKFEMMPEIPEIDFSKVKVNIETSVVTDTDVDKMINKLQKQKQEWKDSKSKISQDDLITIEYVAKNGKNQIHPQTGKDKMGILIGESGIPDKLIDALIDMKIGESDSVKAKFPKGFNVEPMADKELTIEFAVKTHQKGKLPKIDKEFVQSFGVESGKEADLKSEIKANLQRELSNAMQAKTKATVLQALRKKVQDVTISDKMISRESAALAHQAMEQAQQMGVQNPPHLDHKEFVEKARERILNSLIISKIAKDEKIQVDYTKVREKVVEISQTFESPPQIVEYYYKTPELLSSIENTIIETQVIDWLAGEVDLSEKKVKFDKLMDSFS